MALACGMPEIVRAFRGKGQGNGIGWAKAYALGEIVIPFHGSIPNTLSDVFYTRE